MSQAETLNANSDTLMRAFEGEFATILEQSEPALGPDPFYEVENRHAELAALEHDNILAAKQGDQMALSALIELYRPQLLRMARKYVGNRPQDAEDLAHDVLIKLCKSIASFEDPGKGLAPFLTTVMKNHFIGTRRKKMNSNELLGIEGDIGQTNASSDGPDTVEDHFTRNVEARDAAKELFQYVVLASPSGEEYAKAFLLYCEGYSNNEIAEQLGIPPGTVRSRVHRAREVLQHMPEEDKVRLGIAVDAQFGLRSTQSAE